MRTWAAILLASCLVGCTFHRPFVPTTSIALGPKEDPIAVVTGMSSARYYLCFGPFGDDSTTAALFDAMASTNADAIINPVVERKWLIVPFIFARKTTIVTGTAIKYKDAQNFRGYNFGSRGKWAALYSAYDSYVEDLNIQNSRSSSHKSVILSFDAWKKIYSD